MHPERGIVRTDRQSDGISTIPDDPYTFTRQFSNTKNAPRDLLHRPVTNPILRSATSVFNKENLTLVIWSSFQT